MQANEQSDERMAQYSTCFYPLCGGGSNGEAKGSLFFLHKLSSMSTGAVFHERTLHGGFKPQKRIEMLVLGYLLVCHLRAPLRSLILWLARFAALTQSLPSLRKDMSLRLFLTIVRSRCANYRQTCLRIDGQTDGQALFRWVHK